jgi:hypothetical protein
MESQTQEKDTAAVAFKRVYGVRPETFEKMSRILQERFDVMHKAGGSPPKLTVEDKLYITLKYLRDYRSQESLAADYKVCKGTICLSIRWVEDTLAQHKDFKLPGKRVLRRRSANIQHVVVDATESPINRPKKTKGSIIPAKRNVTR